MYIYIETCEHITEIPNLSVLVQLNLLNFYFFTNPPIKTSEKKYQFSVVLTVIHWFNGKLFIKVVLKCPLSEVRHNNTLLKPIFGLKGKCI